MKALSIRQPWLYCITDLDKHIENRSWLPPEKIIGTRIALHSSKKYDRAEYALASRIAGKSLTLAYERGEVVHGAIVATAVVRGYLQGDGSGIGHHRNDKYFSDKWYFGECGWFLYDIKKLVKPIPCSGALRLWNVPEHMIAEINSAQ